MNLRFILYLENEQWGGKGKRKKGNLVRRMDVARGQAKVRSVLNDFILSRKIEPLQ